MRVLCYVYEQFIKITKHKIIITWTGQRIVHLLKSECQQEDDEVKKNAYFILMTVRWAIMSIPHLLWLAWVETTAFNSLFLRCESWNDIKWVEVWSVWEFIVDSIPLPF